MAMDTDALLDRWRRLSATYLHRLGLSVGRWVVGAPTGPPVRTGAAVVADTLDALRRLRADALPQFVSDATVLDDPARIYLYASTWLGTAYGEVITEAGLITNEVGRVEAARRALTELAEAGVQGYVDVAGRRRELVSLVESAVRTMGMRQELNGRLHEYVDEGRDLVVVSDVGQECRLCRPWEGRLLSIRGLSTGRPSLADAQAGGLYHPGCRHDLRPYVGGPIPKAERDPEGERQRVRQRYLERQVRAAKRAVLAEDAMRAGGADVPRVASATLRARQARLREHVRAVGGNAESVARRRVRLDVR